MAPIQTLQLTSKPVEPWASPARISFSTGFLDENNFISISPNPQAEQNRNAEFEFLSDKSTNMITADELISEGKLLPFWEMHNAENLKNISLKEEGREKNDRNEKEEPRLSWFIDEDPSPRPPKCTVLWKELLKLKKQRNLTLSPSSSSRSSISENPSSDEKKDGGWSKDKAVKRIKKGLERTRSASIRIKPVINVPIRTQRKSSSLPPLFPVRRAKLGRL